MFPSRDITLFIPINVILYADIRSVRAMCLETSTLIMLMFQMADSQKCACSSEGFYKQIEDSSHFEDERKSNKKARKVDNNMYEVEVSYFVLLLQRQY